MKRLLALGAYLLCLLNSSVSYSQYKDINENLVNMDSTTSSGPFVCKLTGPEFQKRKAELQKEVFAQVSEVEEVENGYVFYFTGEESFVLKLMDYILAENKCCPFFQHDLSIKANQAGIAWKVSGAPEAKEMIKMLVETNDY